MTLSAFLGALGNTLAAILSPDRCAACPERVPPRTIFCAACAASVVSAPFDGRLRVAAFVYGGAVAHAISAFKYQRRPHLARPLGELLRRGASRLAPFTPDIVVPVPLHPVRLAERGFNQAALLARPVATSFGARFEPLGLARTRDTPQQARLDRCVRLANVTSAFLARDPARIAGASVLLVDDVSTTGATLDACERALRDAGAKHVRAIVIAASDG